MIQSSSNELCIPPRAVLRSTDPQIMLFTEFKKQLIHLLITPFTHPFMWWKSVHLVREAAQLSGKFHLAALRVRVRVPSSYWELWSLAKTAVVLQTFLGDLNILTSPGPYKICHCDLFYSTGRVMMERLSLNPSLCQGRRFHPHIPQRCAVSPYILPLSHSLWQLISQLLTPSGGTKSRISHCHSLL